MTEAVVTSEAELIDLLRGRATGERVRLRGRGTRPALLPPIADAMPVSLRGLDTVERVEPDDLTCTVQAGVPCAELAATLAQRGLELGGLEAGDRGTIGGLLAADPLPLAGPGVPCPRAALLGLDAVLADGSAFRSGARVVKSVAGFDVHRLLVGSRGRLYAAVRVHLKLRPLPRVRATFAVDRLDAAVALQRFAQLRRLPTPARRLVLRRDPTGLAVDGEFVGRSLRIDDLLAAHGLQQAPRGGDHLAPPGDRTELVVGCVRPSTLPELIAALPEGAPFLVHAGGHFEAQLPPSATDTLLAALPALGAHAAVARGRPDRIGHGTALDPGASHLQERLRRALDPDEVLA